MPYVKEYNFPFLLLLCIIGKKLNLSNRKIRDGKMDQKHRSMI